jgi:hypothetical protein
MAARIKSVSGAGALVALILVLAFGNPAFADWAEKSTSANNAGGFFLRQLAWPQWSFSTDDSLRNLIAADLKAVLLVVFTALFLSLLADSATAGMKGTVGAVFKGWGAFIFAAAFAALIAAFVSSDASLLAALVLAGVGAAYGLFVGWIVGLATLAFKG